MGIDDCLCEHLPSEYYDPPVCAELRTAGYHCEAYAIEDVGIKTVAPLSAVIALSFILLILWRCFRCCRACGASVPQDGCCCCCSKRRWGWEPSERKRERMRYALVALGVLPTLFLFTFGIGHNAQIAGGGVEGPRSLAFDKIDNLDDTLGVLRGRVQDLQDSTPDFSDLSADKVDDARDQLRSVKDTVNEVYDAYIDKYDGDRTAAFLAPLGVLCLVFLGVAAAGWFRMGTNGAGCLFFVVVLFAVICLLQQPVYHAVSTVFSDICADGGLIDYVKGDGLQKARADLGCVDPADPWACKKGKPLCDGLHSYRDIKEEIFDALDIPALCDKVRQAGKTSAGPTCTVDLCDAADPKQAVMDDMTARPIRDFLASFEQPGCTVALTLSCNPLNPCTQAEKDDIARMQSAIRPLRALLETLDTGVLPYVHCELVDKLPGEVDDIVCGGFAAGFAGAHRVLVTFWLFVVAALIMLPIAAKWNDAARGKWAEAPPEPEPEEEMEMVADPEDPESGASPVESTSGSTRLIDEPLLETPKQEEQSPTQVREGYVPLRQTTRGPGLIRVTDTEDAPLNTLDVTIRTRNMSRQMSLRGPTYPPPNRHEPSSPLSSLPILRPERALSPILRLQGLRRSLAPGGSPLPSPQASPAPQPQLGGVLGQGPLALA